MTKNLINEVEREPKRSSNLKRGLIAGLGLAALTAAALTIGSGDSNSNKEDRPREVGSTADTFEYTADLVYHLRDSVYEGLKEGYTKPKESAPK